MTRILFICQDKHYHKPKEITTDLRQEGWDVVPVDIGSINFSKMRHSDADLAVIHLHTDVWAWEAYLDLKQQIPELPVLVYMRHHARKELNAAIKNVFYTKRQAESRP